MRPWNALNGKPPASKILGRCWHKPEPYTFLEPHTVPSQDNIIHGRFLAELTKEVLLDLEASKYQHAELRISIYGRKRVEWDILAAWVCQHNIYSDNVTWLIQVPGTFQT